MVIFHKINQKKREIISPILLKLIFSEYILGWFHNGNLRTNFGEVIGIKKVIVYINYCFKTF